jgi:hypothetical protein
MYASIGIFALVLAYHVGASTGRAGNAQFALLGDEGGPAVYITEDGAVWEYLDSGWRNTLCTVGLPLSNIAAFQGRYLVDTNGQLWLMRSNTCASGGAAYEFIGSPPGVASTPEPSVEPSTWGRIKGQASR